MQKHCIALSILSHEGRHFWWKPYALVSGIIIGYIINYYYIWSILQNRVSKWLSAFWPLAILVSLAFTSKKEGGNEEEPEDVFERLKIYQVFIQNR